LLKIRGEIKIRGENKLEKPIFLRIILPQGF